MGKEKNLGQAQIAERSPEPALTEERSREGAMIIDQVKQGTA